MAVLAAAWLHAPLQPPPACVTCGWEGRCCSSMSTAAALGAPAAASGAVTPCGGAAAPRPQDLPAHAPVLILFPGLTGGSGDSYVRHAGQGQGFRAGQLAGARASCCAVRAVGAGRPWVRSPPDRGCAPHLTVLTGCPCARCCPCSGEGAVGGHPRRGVQQPRHGRQPGAHPAVLLCILHRRQQVPRLAQLHASAL